MSEQLFLNIPQNVTKTQAVTLKSHGITEEDLRHEAKVLGRIARTHFLKAHTTEECDSEIYDRLKLIIKAVRH